MLPFTATEGIQLQENTISNTWLPPPLLLQKVYNCNKPSVDIPGRRHHHHHHYNSRYSTARKCHFKYLASTITTTTTTEGTQLQQNISWHTWPPPPPPLLQKVFNCNKTSVDIPGHHHHHHCYRRYSTATKHQLTYLATTTTTTTTATKGIQLQQNISWHTWPPPPPLLQKVFNCNKTADIPGHHYHHHHCYRRHSTATKHQLTYLTTTTTTTATEGIQLQQNSWHTWPPLPPPPLLQKVFNCNKTSVDIPDHHHHHCYRRYSTATKHQLTYLTTTTTTATEGIQLQQNISWHTWPPPPPPPAPLLQKVFNYNKTSVEIPGHRRCGRCSLCWWCCLLVVLAAAAPTSPCSAGCFLCSDGPGATWGMPSALHHVSLHLFEKVRWTIDKVSTESPLTDKKSERRTCTHLADSRKTVTRGTELDIYY